MKRNHGRDQRRSHSKYREKPIRKGTIKANSDPGGGGLAKEHRERLKKSVDHQKDWDRRSASKTGVRSSISGEKGSRRIATRARPCRLRRAVQRDQSTLLHAHRSKGVAFWTRGWGATGAYMGKWNETSSELICTKRGRPVSERRALERRRKRPKKIRKDRTGIAGTAYMRRSERPQTKL